MCLKQVFNYKSCSIVPINNKPTQKIKSNKVTIITKKNKISYEISNLNMNKNA